MSQTTNSYTYSNLNFTEERTESNANNHNIFEIFNNTTEIFTKVRPTNKKGSRKGWLNNLLSPVEAQDLTEHTDYNVGIKCGTKTENGYTVVFDKEKGGILPEETRTLLEESAVAIWTSPHGGTNYLLTVSEESLDLLKQYKEKVYITGENHDLEILKSKHALVPPSSINHNSCSENKPCNGYGTDEYELEYTGYTQELDLQNVRTIIDTLPVEESEQTAYNTDNQGRNGNEEVSLPELSEDFEPTTYFKNEIPGKDSFHERIETMLEVPEIRKLWYGDYEDGSVNELKLRSYIAFYFNADRKMVQYIFEEMLPPFRDNELKYQENKYHAKDVLNIQISRPYYTTGISFNLREQLASEILKRETVTVNELQGGWLLRTDKAKEYDQRTIQRGLRIFNQLGVIERVSDNTYRNKNIDKQYIEKLEDLNDEYKPTNIEDNIEEYYE